MLIKNQNNKITLNQVEELETVQNVKPGRIEPNLRKVPK